MILRELVIDHSFLKCQNWVEIPVHTVCETLDMLHNPSESCFLNWSSNPWEDDEYIRNNGDILQHKEH